MKKQEIIRRLIDWNVRLDRQIYFTGPTKYYGFFSFNQRKLKNSETGSSIIVVDHYKTCCGTKSYAIQKKGSQDYYCRVCNDYIFHIGYLRKDEIQKAQEELMEKKKAFPEPHCVPLFAFDPRRNANMVRILKNLSNALVATDMMLRKGE